jgi:predicted ATPase
MNRPSVALTQLTIHDFRGIESLDLDFVGPDGLPNQLVVLAGPNGSGKTAVLEAALIAAGGQEKAVGPTGLSARRRGAEDYEIIGRFHEDATGLDDETRSTSRKKLRPEEAPLGTPPSLWYFSSWRAPRLVGPVDVTVGKPGRRPAKTDQNRLRNVKNQLVNEAAKARFRSGPLPTLPTKYDQWIAEINSNWRRFYPSAGGEFLVDLAEAQEEAAGAFDVYYQDRQGKRLEVDYLSSGQVELFLFLAALVLNDERQGLVFIDEPELHLDPQWHRPLLKCLTSLQPRAQFLIATHSPEIYDAARSYERHFLVPADDPRALAWQPTRSARAET